MAMGNGSIEHIEAGDRVSQTVEIVSSFVSNNSLAASEVVGLIASVHKTLSGLTETAPEAPAIAEPVVSVRASIKPDHLICLECGAKLKTLKRHINSMHGLTPDQYISKYGLPATYPMIAADYSARRSRQAKQIGLGRKNDNGSA